MYVQIWPICPHEYKVNVVCVISCQDVPFSESMCCECCMCHAEATSSAPQSPRPSVRPPPATPAIPVPQRSPRTSRDSENAHAQQAQPSHPTTSTPSSGSAQIQQDSKPKLDKTEESLLADLLASAMAALPAPSARKSERKSNDFSSDAALKTLARAVLEQGPKGPIVKAALKVRSLLHIDQVKKHHAMVTAHCDCRDCIIYTLARACCLFAISISLQTSCKSGK